MKTSFTAFTMVITLMTAAQSAPSPWMDTKPNYLMQPHEQAPSGHGLRCFECTENCSTTQIEVNCSADFNCYTLQAFDIVLNTSIFSNRCIPEFFCVQNLGCDLMNQTRGGSLESCSISCCNTSLCNDGSTTSSLPATTMPPPTTTPPPTPAPTTIRTPTTLPTTFTPTTTSFQPGNVGCGTTKAGTRIVGGTDAQPGSWPWQVLLDLKVIPGPYWCAGSILSAYWIVTAAHCFQFTNSPIDYIVTAGEHDVTIVEGNEQIIPVDTILIHPDYNPATSGFDYDVALIKLKNPIKYNIDVRPVCLPTTDFVPGTDCYITGWGDTTEGGNASRILQQAEVPLVPRDICQQAYNDTGCTITQRMRCAGFSQGGVDSCQGDSGGPLVCPRNNKWYLMGIISWGVGCARPGRYGVYADMFILKTWVEETINDNPIA